MHNLLFFLWMMFFPLVDDIADYIVWKTYGKPKPEDTETILSNTLWMITYFFIAYLLYEPH